MLALVDRFENADPKEPGEHQRPSQDDQHTRERPDRLDVERSALVLIEDFLRQTVALLDGSGFPAGAAVLCALRPLVPPAAEDADITQMDVTARECSNVRIEQVRPLSDDVEIEAAMTVCFELRNVLGHLRAGTTGTPDVLHLVNHDD